MLSALSLCTDRVWHRSSELHTRSSTIASHDGAHRMSLSFFVPSCPPGSGGRSGVIPRRAYAPNTLVKDDLSLAGVEIVWPSGISSLFSAGVEQGGEHKANSPLPPPSLAGDERIFPLESLATGAPIEALTDAPQHLPKVLASAGPRTVCTSHTREVSVCILAQSVHG